MVVRLFGVITLDEVKEDHVLLKITDSRFYSQWTLAESLEIKMGEAVEGCGLKKRRNV